MRILKLKKKILEESFFSNEDIGNKRGYYFYSIPWKKPAGFSTDSNEPTYMYLIRSVIKSSFRRLSPSFILLFESQNKDSTWKQWFYLEKLHKLLSFKSLKSWRKSSDVSLKSGSKTCILIVPYVFSSHDLDTLTQFDSNLSNNIHHRKNKCMDFFTSKKTPSLDYLSVYATTILYIFLCQTAVCLFLFIYTIFCKIKFNIFT